MMIINLLQRRRGRCSYFQQSKQHLIFFSSKPPSIHMYDQPSILNDTLLKIVNSGKYFKKKKKKRSGYKTEMPGKHMKVTSIKSIGFLHRMSFVLGYNKYMLLKSLCQNPFCFTAYSIIIYIEAI